MVPARSIINFGRKFKQQWESWFSVHWSEIRTFVFPSSDRPSAKQNLCWCRLRISLELRASHLRMIWSAIQELLCYKNDIDRLKGVEQNAEESQKLELYGNCWEHVASLDISILPWYGTAWKELSDMLCQQFLSCLCRWGVFTSKDHCRHLFL